MPDCPRIFKKDSVVTFYVLNDNFFSSQVACPYVLINTDTFSLFFFFSKILAYFSSLFFVFFNFFLLQQDSDFFLRFLYIQKFICFLLEYFLPDSLLDSSSLYSFLLDSSSLDSFSGRSSSSESEEISYSSVV